MRGNLKKGTFDENITIQIFFEFFITLMTASLPFLDYVKYEPSPNEVLHRGNPFFIKLFHSISFYVATSDKRQIVLYWGQNTARLPEKNLHHFCTTGDYDVIVIQHITKFFAGESKFTIPRIG